MCPPPQPPPAAARPLTPPPGPHHPHAHPQYDEPVGKNDGSTKTGARYFTCRAGYGGFARPALVRCGDYPPFDEELFGSEDEL